MNVPEMLQTLQAWRSNGWLRALDMALVNFLHGLDANTPPGLLLAAAWLAQLEGRGHSCLPLHALHADAQAWLAWPPEADASVAAALAHLPAHAGAARAAWAGSSVIEIDPPDPPDAHGATPLVLQGGSLYLRRYWGDETQIAKHARQRALPLEDEQGQVDPARARSLLAQLFVAGGDMAGHTGAEPDWQQVACALALRGRLCLITGRPGTGKTYTAARLLVLQQALHSGRQPLRVALAAPTGKAAARLRQAMVAALQGLQQPAGLQLPLDAWAATLAPARTLHALLGTRPGTRRFVHDAANALDVDLLFVDEASVVHLEMMAALLQALPADARLVLLGDRDQLASVEAGAVMGELCAGAGAYAPETVQWVQACSGQVLTPDTTASADGLAQQTVVLRQSRRFAGPIGQLAQAVNRGEGAAALAMLRAAPGAELALVQTHEAQAAARLAVHGRAGAEGGYAACLHLLAQRPTAPAAFEPWVRELLTRFDPMRVLCAVREGPWGVAGLNAAIEAALAKQGLLRRAGEWYEGRPVMVTRNEPALGVFNGDIGLVLASPGGTALRAWFIEGSTLRSVATSRLADVETAFAMTVHKSQGSEFARGACAARRRQPRAHARARLHRHHTRQASLHAGGGRAQTAGDRERATDTQVERPRRLAGMKGAAAAWPVQAQRLASAYRLAGTAP